MKAWGAAVVMVMVGLVGIAVPTGAVAKPGYFVTGNARTAKFKVRASNGYVIELEAGARRNRKQAMRVTAKKGRASVAYEVPGALSPDDSIDVHLPHIGRIAVHFDPVHVTRRPTFTNCKGRASVVEHGYFRGTIRLRGERGFTSLDRTSVHGRVIQHFRQVCDNSEPSGGHERGPRFRVTTLLSGERRGLLGFSATEASFGQDTYISFSVDDFQRREGMSVHTYVSTEGHPGDIVVSPHASLKSAEVKPPAPFEGSATFSLISPQTSTWEGDLAVELPGQDKVSLAGPNHWAVLCKDERCSDTAPPGVSIISVSRSAG